MSAATVALDRAFDYVGGLICKARGCHLPMPTHELDTAPPREGGWQRRDGIFQCACGWACCLPYIVTAARVVFLPGECGVDGGKRYFRWRVM
jgi:hypothetical protein